MNQSLWHTSSCLAFLALLLVAACRSHAPAAGETSAPTAAPSERAIAPSPSAPRRTDNLPKQLVERNHMRSEGIVEWNGSVVSRTTPPLVLDLASRRGNVLSLPGCGQPVALATVAGRPVALCKASGSATLAEYVERAWKPRALPAKIDVSERTPILAGDEKELWLLTERSLYRLRGDTWTSSDVPAIPTQFPGGYRHALLHAGRLYVGQDRGEWGGSLMVLDADKKSWHAEPGFSSPIHDLRHDKKGALWVVSGLSHLGMHEGALHRLDGTTFTLVASSQAAVGSRAESRGGDWNLAGTSFDAVAFDAENRAVLLTGLLGLARHDKTGWTRLTPGWNDFVYLAGLAIVDDTAVIASYDAGLVLADLASGKLEEVASR